MSVPLGRIGVWSRELFRHDDRGAIADAAAEAEELGYTALWIPGGHGGDVLGASRHLLEATRSVPVATGILNVWLQGEAGEVAKGTAAIEADHPDRFLLGLGVSHAPAVNKDEPGRYRKPLSKMRSYLDELDEADPPVAPDKRMLAALGPRMLELSRDRSAGAHPYFVPVEHTRAAREILGADAELAPEQAVLLETDPQQARETARGHVARYLELPNYANNLRRLGYDDDDLERGGSDRLVDAIVAWGDEEAIAARIAAHHEAGADHVCIQVVEAGELPRDAWRRLAPALTEAAVSRPAR
jgi:probable F420-dependent oxidoreductase